MNGHVQDELPALLGGELPPSAAAAVRAHLDACDRCRLELAAVVFAAGELRAAAAGNGLTPPGGGRRECGQS